VVKLIRSDKSEYQRNLIRGFQHNPKRFYGYKRPDGSLITNDQEAATIILCDYFSRLQFSHTNKTFIMFCKLITDYKCNRRTCF